MMEIDTARSALAKPGARIALVGASRATHKYGNIILRNLHGRGYSVLPVNTHENTIEGLTVYRKVADVPPPIDIINVVTPPDRSLEIARTVPPTTCEILWFQPGAFDDAVVAAARKRFPVVLAGDCIMVLAAQVRRRDG